MRNPDRYILRGVEVTDAEFWKAIGPLDVHPRLVEPYPYVSIFETRNREEVGRRVPVARWDEMGLRAK